MRDLSSNVAAAGVVLMLSALSIGAAGAPQSGGTAPPGRLIDIDGHRLHIHCTGQGAPTVVIDGGAGTWSIHYSHIQAVLAGEMRVCTYDRAGLGWSDDGPLPRTSGRMAGELHRLLHAAGVAPPLLLVGHSLGGYTVRVYQDRYPEEVGGLVLVEAAHETQWEALPPEWAAGVKTLVGALRERAELARHGGITAADVNPGAFTAHAPEWREAHVAAQLTPRMYLAVAAENEGAFESARQVPRGRRPDLPLVVLTARRSFDAFAGSGLDTGPANRIWLQLQHGLAHLSSKAVHLFSDHDHALHATDPGAIVNAVRTGAAMVGGDSSAPAALGLGAAKLPATSTPEIDGLLRDLEDAYRSMDADRFARLFTDDMVQLDVPRRVHVKGRDQWLAWTRVVNEAHQTMNRQHRGRARVGDWVIAEVEWSGRVKGDAVGSPGRSREYRFTGLVMMRLRDGRIAEQIVYGDAPALSDQLGAGDQPSQPDTPQPRPVPEWVGAYFKAMVGTWIADNSAYRSDAEPFDAYGMEWKPGIGGKSLVGRLYALQGGREAGLSWEFREFWHPGEGELVASQFGSDGTYGVGPHGRRPDGTMEMVQTFYHPTGRVTRVGHRSELKADELVTRSFDVQADGTREPRRTYVWRRHAGEADDGPRSAQIPLDR